MWAVIPAARRKVYKMDGFVMGAYYYYHHHYYLVILLIINMEYKMLK